MVVDAAVAACGSYEEAEVTAALRQVLEAVGGLGWVKPGMKVAVKANLVAPMRPEAAATTHPALLAALTRELVALGAKVIVGDSPGGLYNAVYVNRVYAAAGLKTVEEAGGHLNRNFEERDRAVSEPLEAKTLRYTAWLDEADAVITFAKLKTHGMMGLSAAAKNMFGVIPGTLKPEYHMLYPTPMRFSRMILDINREFPVKLALVDGVVGMEGNGPTAGRPRKVGCLLAGADPYKVDMLAAKIIGLEPKQVPTLAAAMEAGRIPETLEEITLNTPAEPFFVPDFDTVRNANHLLEQNGNAALWGGAADRFLQRFLAARPAPEKASCVGCGKCAGLCPAKAITMKKGIPSIDRRACIRCFCCQEFCPVGAMKVKRTPLARWAGKL